MTADFTKLADTLFKAYARPQLEMFLTPVFATQEQRHKVRAFVAGLTDAEVVKAFAASDDGTCPECGRPREDEA